jgi:FkbM family methyltransferase
MHIQRGPARGMKWISGSATHGCWLGTYELEKQRLLERLIKPGMTIYDVGAQAGFYTLMLSRMVGDSGEVFAFEPSIREARYLIEHVRLNRLRNVHIVQAAVGATPGLSGFSIDRPPCENRLIKEDDGLLVPVVNLDSLSLPPPDLIKMDIEGGESAALEGAVRILYQSHPLVLVALHGEGHARYCPDLLRKYDYKIFALDDSPIANVADVSEIYAVPAGRDC